MKHKTQSRRVTVHTTKDEFADVLRKIYDACIEFNELVRDNSFRPSNDVSVKRAQAASKKRLSDSICQNLGYGGLVEIQRAMNVIEPVLVQDDRRHMQASRIKSKAAGDKVNPDAIYHTVMVPALSLFFRVRQVTTNIMTGIDLRSGNEISKTEARAIKALPELPAGKNKWAQLIVKFTLSGKYWADKTALESGGELYEEIQASAVRNRKGKGMRAFKKRYFVRSTESLRGIAPLEFLGYSAEKQVEVIDCSMRGGREPLDYYKADRTKAKALAIENMVPTWCELKRELTALVTERLSTIPRN